MPRSLIVTRPPSERAILAGAEVKQRIGALTLEDSLDELSQLARTAGATVAAVVGQRLDRPSPSYLGKGKLEEIRDLAAERHATVVILDDELSPSQQEVIERIVNTKVIDRTALIIDIFAGRARTKEGRLQVELAQHEYLLPRLAGQWSHLERLGGGIGTRGPGESQIETDRRLIRNRIHRLKRELDEVRTHRALYRDRRKRDGIPIISLIGYTNAGKSTLFNALGRAQTLVENKLFATLDPVTRRARFPSGAPFLLTDTVGFINKLPHGLVAAFRATLEELADADVLVHVVDITHRNAAEQARVVDETIREMGLPSKPVVVALNKADLLAPGLHREAELADLAQSLKGKVGDPGQPTVLISADKRWGLGALLQMLDDTFQASRGGAIPVQPRPAPIML
ncbi:MAG: GTPase HflX [Dehalococcoidia bacterium]|nr:GTPase HflX [Dehalococcoidia bacterium]